MMLVVLGSFAVWGDTHFSAGLWPAVAVVVFFAIALLVFIAFAIIRAHRSRVNTGKEGLVGETAIAQTPLDPEGVVFVKGELWKASAENGRIEPGEKVTITGVEGLKLRVVKGSKRR